MIKNYLLLTFRNMSRNKVFAFINIFGLSIGLAACILIFLYTKDELSFDRFHQNTSRLYQLTCTVKSHDGKLETYGIAGNIHAEAFKAEIPEIKEFVRLRDDDLVIKIGDQSYEEKLWWADKNFFNVFSFPLIEGDKNSVLKDMKSMVISEEYAKKYFGNDNAIGKIIEVEFDDQFVPFTVTGIAKKTPQNSSIKFDMIASFDYLQSMNPKPAWFMLSYPSFLVLNENADVKAIANSMQKVYNSKSGYQKMEKDGFDSKFIWGLQPFVDMHLNKDIKYSMSVSDPVYSYILSCIALFILIIACINFVNLMVAQSLKRSKEIGVRKVIGGSRKQLFVQFIGEAFTMCFIAFGLAFLIAELSLPYFNTLAEKELSIGYLFDAKLIAGFVLLFLITVLASGFYPALVLSGFDPVRTLYNRTTFSSKNYLVKGLVVLQFSLATFLIIGTLFIYNQLNYLKKVNLGYDDKNLLQVSISKGDNMALLKQFQDKVAALPGVESVAPTMDGDWVTSGKVDGKNIEAKYDFIGEEFLPTMKVPLIEGRNFSKEFPGDTSTCVLVNQAFVKEVGWKGSAIGKTIKELNGMEQNLKVVGVVRDYHFESLHEKIIPQVFTCDKMVTLQRFLIRIDEKNKSKTLAGIEQVYNQLLPYHPFKYEFIDDVNKQYYKAEDKWKQIISMAAILTIFISCIGLFGLSSLAVQKRVKEIGVRKVLGASVMQISNLLTRNFISLIAIAFVIAVPAAWYAGNMWLQNYAYRMPFNASIFLLALVIILVVSLATISFQSIKAAITNPVKSLRSE
ncbi:MAG: ABC transporter permease [Bacteroidetes bacterium]|nr:ABC transporter permease [Bacteroidota bacterium]